MVASDIKFDILYTGWSEKSGTLGNGCKTINLLLKYLIITDHNTRSWEHLLVKNLRNQMNRTHFMKTNVTNLLFTKFAPDGGHRAGDRRPKRLLKLSTMRSHCRSGIALISSSKRNRKRFVQFFFWQYERVIDNFRRRLDVCLQRGGR